MKFCRDHALPEQFVPPLTEHIVSNIISIRCRPICCTLRVDLSKVNVNSQDFVFSRTKIHSKGNPRMFVRLFPICSKEDSDIVFHSQEQPMSDHENSTVHCGAPYSPVMHGSDVVDSVPKPRDYKSRPGSRPVTAETSALLARREHRSHTDSVLMASQKINRNQGNGHHHCDEMKPKRKTRRKKGRKKVSERLIAPTITSMAKTGALDREKPRTPHLNRPLSEAAVSLDKLESSRYVFIRRKHS